MLLATVALAALGATAAACGEPPPPPDLDDLMTQLDMARSDSRLASDAATAADPRMRPALAAVSSDRSKHAEALSDEITRITGEPTTSSPTTTTTVEQPAPPTAKDVAAALRKSADSAAQTAAQLAGYRAGLLASIAASCTAAYTVALA
jgi:sirohydrochlorin ferrochelatase